MNRTKKKEEEDITATKHTVSLSIHAQHSTFHGIGVARSRYSSAVGAAAARAARPRRRHHCLRRRRARLTHAVGATRAVGGDASEGAASRRRISVVARGTGTDAGAGSGAHGGKRLVEGAAPAKVRGRSNQEFALVHEIQHRLGINKSKFGHDINLLHVNQRFAGNQNSAKKKSQKKQKHIN